MPSALQIPDVTDPPVGAVASGVPVPATSVRIELRADIPTWPTAFGILVTGWEDFGTPQFLWYLDGTGTPYLEWNDPAFQSALSSVPWPFVGGDVGWMAVELDFAGSVTFEFSYDDTDDPTAVTWTTLDTVAVAATSISAGVECRIGKGSFGQSVPGWYRVARFVVDGVDEGWPDFTLEAPGTTSFIDSLGVTWDVVGDANIVEHPAPIGDVLLGGAVLLPVVNAPRVWLPEDLIHPLRARLVMVDGTAVAGVTSTFGDQCRAQRSMPGTGSVALMSDDPVVSLLGPNQLVQVIVEGQAAFTFLAKDRSDDVLAMGEESQEVVRLAGPGHLALLARGLIYPSRGPGAEPVQRARVFDWTERFYNDSAWPAAIAAGAATGPDRLPGAPAAGPPAGMPSEAGNAWWGAPGTTAQDAPPGDYFYRWPMEAPYTGEFLLLWAADNDGELYADGTEISRLTGAGGTRNYLTAEPLLIRLTAGVIQMAVHVHNKPGLVGFNPVGFTWMLCSVDDADEIAEVLAYGNTDMKAIGPTSAPPGMTVGEVGLLALDEWSERALAAGQNIPPIEPSWTIEADTAGNPWPYVQIATQVGTDLLTFFTEIAATYWDMRMRPGSLVLDAWNKGTIGASGVAYTQPPPDSAAGAGNLRTVKRRFL